MKEVKLGRYAGPFATPPTEHFVQSPIGLVPKAGNKTRLIFHLSYDFGVEDKDKSINYHTPEQLCSVKYHDLDEAIKQSLLLLGTAEKFGGRLVYSKSDCSSAFRILPILPGQ